MDSLYDCDVRFMTIVFASQLQCSLYNLWEKRVPQFTAIMMYDGNFRLHYRHMFRTICISYCRLRHSNIPKNFDSNEDVPFYSSELPTLIAIMDQSQVHPSSFYQQGMILQEGHTLTSFLDFFFFHFSASFIVLSFSIIRNR